MKDCCFITTIGVILKASQCREKQLTDIGVCEHSIDVGVHICSHWRKAIAKMRLWASAQNRILERTVPWSTYIWSILHIQDFTQSFVTHLLCLTWCGRAYICPLLWTFLVLRERRQVYCSIPCQGIAHAQECKDREKKLKCRYKVA